MRQIIRIEILDFVVNDFKNRPQPFKRSFLYYFESVKEPTKDINKFKKSDESVH